MPFSSLRETFNNDPDNIDILTLLYCNQISTDLLIFIKRQIWSRINGPESLSHRDMQALLFLTQSGGRLTPSKIADPLRIDRASMSRISRNLEELGFVTVDENASDNRSVDLVATPKGQDLCDRYHAQFVAAFDAVNEKYSNDNTDDERRRIIDTLNKLAVRAAISADEKKPLNF